MEDLRTLQRQEAIRRLKILQVRDKLIEIVINAFADKNIVCYSEYIGKNLQGILFHISKEEKIATAVKRFEEKHNAFVYHAIVIPMEFGRMLNLLYVSPHEEEWEQDRKDLIDRQPIAYCLNLDDKDSSEFGTIQVAGPTVV